MSWLEFSVRVAIEHAEAIEDFLLEHSALAVTIEDQLNEDIFEPDIGTTPRWQLNKLTALFETSLDADHLFSRLQQQFPECDLSDFQLEALEDREWEREWLRYYESMCFANRLWVIPSLSQEEQQKLSTDIKAHHVVLNMDPGLAFGTGTHETTWLCLDWLASHKIQGKTLIDYGCGSGILGIAAALLGANKVNACDIDPQAILATRENARRNNIESNINIELVSDLQSRLAKSPDKADILIANILAGPLQKLCPELANLVDSGAIIVLSGILHDQKDDILGCYQSFFTDFQVTQKNDWLRIVAIRK